MPHPTEMFLLCDRYLKGLRKIRGQGFHPSNDISFLVREGVTIRTPDESSEYRNKRGSTEPKNCIIHLFTVKKEIYPSATFASGTFFKISSRNFSKWSSSSCSERRRPLQARRYTHSTIFSITNRT